MKPQLYSILVLLLSRINYVQNSAELNTTQDAAASGTTLPLFTPDNNTTSVAETPDDNVTSVTEAPDGNTTSVTKTSEEAPIVSGVPDDDVTFVSEAPNGNATSAPTMATSTSPASHTTRSTTRITDGANILTANRTSNPDTARSTTTQRTSEVNISHAASSTTYSLPRSIKPTVISMSPDKTTRNRTSTFPVPSLFAIMLLVVSVLCF